MIHVLLPFSLLVLVYGLVDGPLMEELMDHDKELPKGVLLVLELAFFITFCLVSLFGITATINASAVAYIGKSTVLAAMFYLYLVTVWVLSLVVSIVEEDCYGMKALGKARELIKGRKVPGFVLFYVDSTIVK
ncbi:hypothetical protein HHK36_013718 [Tetracentron sinense]|uniref:Uncharacterized protein n=1 Tax=Tetracentron sinense TaxID=13715 RepID=A0A834Z6I4_TETSI|nr:hypothetical protein HHK36_013718 [Tetracentron sinense]